MDTVAIVGGGLAGYTVARTLRDRGHTGRIVVIGSEHHRPYDRTPLSKGYLAGEQDHASLMFDADDDPLDAEWVLGRAAVGLDIGSRTLSLDDGTSLDADEIVIATGSTPVPLAGPCGAASVSAAHVLGTIEHADGLRGALVPGATVVVAGGGFVGLEVAATALTLGAAAVTVITSDPEPLARFGPEASRAIRLLHERRGIRFVTGGRVARVEEDAAGTPLGVRLTDDTLVPGTVVVAGIGSFPNTGWLDGSGLELSPRRAIVCDTSGRAAPGIRAAGDCAAWAGDPCAHWTLAQQQAQHIALDLLAPGHTPAHTEQPYLWSDQHGTRLQFAGRLRGDEIATLEAGSVEGGDPLLVYRDRLGAEVAVLGIGQARAITRWRKLNRLPPLVAGSPEPV
ncbi:oxidoreductase [Pseudoclavibacter chungangensis]|uniref:Oxidoreductase n=1 Tax=Pseudoclavibacter chungangensis TaxID=587635 RepID=A0A7J5BQU9_9MICO|nr:FAD-dependent oxidoreductase [Pseudoclavibacter chungangensis]KAB1656655.1 oxidoreductase [Pseudoclavibacter chungangensis]NYJ67897.1 NADPH-dependent 2,4-dienoyl-CoA reductase/sulfur reductase-like enzyme [Pseudoclavibacter chungangensis]